MNDLEIMAQIKNKFSAQRWQHIMGVYETALKLAQIFGADQEKTGQAALLHDYGKTLNDQQILAQAAQYGLTLDENDYQTPELLHGPIGAKMVAQELGIKDPEILQSISAHTLGNEQMSKIDKIIFLADMIEPNRNYPGLDTLRATVFTDLDRGLLMGFDRTLEYLKSTGRTIHPQTIKSRDAILKTIK